MHLRQRDRVERLTVSDVIAATRLRITASKIVADYFMCVQCTGRNVGVFADRNGGVILQVSDSGSERYS